MLIPKEFIQRLQEQATLSEIIGKRVTLRRKGREFEACCPFHQEKTPSFTVNDAKGFYHCFGCAAHGDGIKFLMEFERLPYPEAIRALAAEMGVAVPQPTQQAVRQEQQRASLQEVVERACRWFGQQLQLSGGHVARDYLAQRGVSAEMVAQFRLGYAPDGRDALRQALLKEGITDAQLGKAGLIGTSEQGQVYDRFRHRLIFPITDAGGHVIAFGGRILDKDDKGAKYLNSPETELFHKGNNLYNFRTARRAVDAKTPLLVAEGYMDVIALAQAGFATAVAPLGTALTENHLQLLWKSCDAPILCLDGDAAGQRAMWRSAELALPHLRPGKTLKFCTLPQGQDPDDLLKNQGAAALQSLLDAAQPLSRVILQHHVQTIGADTPEQAARLDEALEQAANKMGDARMKGQFLRFARQHTWKMRPKKLERAAPPLPVSGLAMLEKQWLKALICCPELLHQAEVEEALGHLQLSGETLDIQRWLLREGAEDAAPSWPPAAQVLRDERTIGLPAELQDEHAPPTARLAAWRQIRDSHHLIALQQELESMQRALAGDLKRRRPTANALLAATNRPAQRKRRYTG